MITEVDPNEFEATYKALVALFPTEPWLKTDRPLLAVFCLPRSTKSGRLLPV